MLTLNRHASHLAREAGAHALTDVTGYGLLGHASEIAARSGVRVVLNGRQAPAFSPAVIELVAGGVTTGGAARNRRGLEGVVEIAASAPSEIVELLYDPQTSGGLLIALAPGRAEALVDQLRADGADGAAVIGYVEAGDGVRVI
jgi:selenide,water dikinase